MTARPAAAESFLALLDDLAGAKAKPSGAAAAVMLAHAATHLRGLLDQVRELEREAEDEAALDEVLAAVRSEIRGQAAASPGGKSRPRNPAWPFTTDAPRPDGPSPVAGSGPGHRDLSHLPPMAGAGEDMCRAESALDPGFWDRWDCTARRGHPERWHAAHDEETGEPHAALFPDAAWPVAARETGLPPWGAAWRGLGSAPGAGYCGATEGRWTCSAVPDHAPLDHVAFAPWDSRLAGAVLARWPSARPPSFEQMLASPDGQFDPRSELLASIAEFANAPSVTAGTVARAAPGGTATLRPDKCPDHDVNMPHDVRYQGWRSCPPKCPYRLWHERHGLTEPPQSNGHALRPPDCAGCGHPWVTHGLNAPGGPCYGGEGACQCAEYEPPGDDARRAGRDSQGKNGGERARLAGRDLSVSPPSPAQDVRRDGMGAQGEPAPWPGAEEIRRLSAVADDGAPAGIGKPCTCLPGVCRGGGCEACAGLDECYLQQEVTTP